MASCCRSLSGVQGYGRVLVAAVVQLAASSRTVYVARSVCPC